METPTTGAAVSKGRPPTSLVGNRSTIGGDPPRPRYLVAELGGWPRTEAARAVWRIAANQINIYRAAAGICDPKTALGPEPDVPDQRSAYVAVARLVQAAAAGIDALEFPTPPDRNDGVALPGPL